MALLRLSLKYARSYWLYIVFVVVLQLAATIAALFLPSLNAQIIDQGVAKGDTDFIWSTGMTMIIVCLVQVVTAVTAIFFGARTGMGVGRDLRRAIYSKVDELSTLEVGRFGSATLITRNTNDVQQVQMLVLMTLNFMVSTPIMCIGGIIMALREDVGLSWLVWVSVPALFIVVGILVYLLMPLFRRMQEQVDDINGVLREQITGIRVVRAFVREPFEADRYADANRALTETSVKVGNLFVLMFPAIMMILHLATAAVLWFGGHRVDAGQMEVGSLTAFLQYLLQILVAVMMGVFMMMMIPRAVVCAERISEVLDSTSSMIIPKGVDELPRRGELEFRNVTFGYPGAEVPVLENLSFTAQPGTTTAIIGATGAGKSTIVNLIPRLLDPQSGDVLIDGVPVSAFNRHQLAQLVGLVPQKPYLFSGTIASNLRFGNEFADDSDLWEALTTAQATDFVTDKTDQLQAGVAQGGTNFSGGQRQRLCIARALAAKPRIFVFDDSFSALDVATDARLRSALDETTGDSTVVVVAQRVSTIRDADQIIVLDEGKIVGRGTHEELVDANETYQEIVESQLATEGVN
ncbi:ABC transporter ATP-binding protein [Brevibacterium sp. UCMA 11752]|uniref:ABC transporter ATP-binding protein n=1 Tax=Brevibacterium sp. UCMA 11752 TaxID=2745946 RepID=UPI001F3C8E8A|nr:ABC transporter ATP-binding protein [Brevibacterium sp. UCMA 11752]MCF2589356.1 ABC transporter ATP-binding protein [Brevibacterium sp. UCMA 11752]